MLWKQMSFDEFALYNRANGVKMKKLAGTWWAEVRPCFFRPPFPFTEIDPNSAQYPARSLIGGYLHAVPSGSAANAEFKMFVYDDIQSYSLQSLGEKQRYITRKGLKNFQVRQIEDVNEFITDAYEIYVSFYDRTKYGYKKERLTKDNFNKWASIMFQFPGIVVLGAYHQEKLSAVDISYRVGNVIIDDTFFSDTHSQTLKVTDCMLHTIREAAASSDAKYLFRGLPTGKQSLDESKTMRGCKVLKMPARCKINPLALLIARCFMKESYSKFVSLTSVHHHSPDTAS